MDTIYSGPRRASKFSLATKHAMVVVGFGTEMVGNQLVKFWIMRNSHSDQWENYGYGRFNLSRIHNRFLVNNGWQAKGHKLQFSRRKTVSSYVIDLIMHYSIYTTYENNYEYRLLGKCKVDYDFLYQFTLHVTYFGV